MLLSFPPLAPNANGAPSIWRTDRADHIGSTAIWLWNSRDNKLNGADQALPFTAAEEPLLVSNGSHVLAEVGYVEQSNTGSNTFWDLIGLPNVRRISYSFTMEADPEARNFGPQGSTPLVRMRLLRLCSPADPTNDLVVGIIMPARHSFQNVGGDASYILQRPPWPGWEASHAYTVTTIPSLIGSLGGLWTAFTRVLAVIFGTSAAFLLFGML